MNWIDQFINMYSDLVSTEKDINAAYSLKEKNLPNLIYKYRNCDGNSFEYFSANKIRLSDPHSFNDPFDSAFTANYMDFWLSSLRRAFRETAIETGLDEKDSSQLIKIVSEAADPISASIDYLGTRQGYDIAKIAELKTQFKKISERNALERHDEFVSGVRSTFRICCFSELKSSILMWSHYADKHSGFVLEYDISKLDEYSPFRRLLFPVIYQDHFHDVADFLQTDKGANYNNRFLNKAALLKSPEWAYEREWRLLLANGLMRNESSCSIVPPSALYIGAKTSPENIAKLVEISKSKAIKVFKMSLRKDGFALEYELLHDFTIHDKN